MSENDKRTDAVKYCEEQYPEMMDEFQRLLAEDYKIFCKKQMDYGPGNSALGQTLSNPEEIRLSLTGLIIRMNDKVQRLLNLIVKHNREAQNEPTVDAFKDLACYGIIAQIVEAGKWGK